MSQSPLRALAPRPDAPPALVFDLDGTLFRERDFAARGFTEATRALLPAADAARAAQACLALFDAGERAHLFRRALVRCGLPHDPTRVAALSQAYRTHRPHIALAPDAGRLLRWLPRSVPTGLISVGRRDVQLLKLRALDLTDRFDHVVLVEDTKRDEAPDRLHAFERMERRLGRSGRSLVYVADDPAADFVVPHARGWMTVQVARTGARPAATDRSRAAETCVRSLDHLVEAVAALSPLA